MKSKIGTAIGLKTNAVALIWSDTLPEGAIKLQAWTMGLCDGGVCHGRGQGPGGRFQPRDLRLLGRGRRPRVLATAIRLFRAASTGFCGFLADGNKGSAEGRAIGEQMATWGGQRMADDFLEGERYLKDPAGYQAFS